MGYKGSVYALRQGLDLDLTEIKQGDLSVYQDKNECFVGSTIEEVKKEIEQEGVSISKVLPRLIESYKKFNIIRYNNLIYTVFQGFDLDFTEIEENKLRQYQKENKLFIGDSVDEAKDFINRFVSLPR